MRGTWCGLLAACACGLFGGVSAALAIDKGDFEKLQPETAERVLMSFESPVYYILSESGDSNVTRFGNDKPAFTSLPIERALLLFLNPTEAAQWSSDVSKQTKLRYRVKASNLNRIMVAQYKTLGKPLATGTEQPDLIVVETMQKVMPVVETLVDPETKQPLTIGEPGRRIIPAFLSREDAMVFQGAVNKGRNTKFERVGRDMRSHLAFVESNINSQTPVITFGYGAIQWIDAYFKRDADAATLDGAKK